MKINLHIFKRELMRYNGSYECFECCSLCNLDDLIGAFYNAENISISYEIKCRTCGKINLDRTAAVATIYFHYVDKLKERLFDED